MKESQSVFPPSSASLHLPQIALRRKLDEEKYSTEVLVPPGGRLGPEEKLEESDIVLDDETDLYVRQSRTGKWIKITGGSAPVIYGIVVEAIRRTEDPAGGAENYMYGKVRVLGKEYPTEDKNGDPIEPGYDACACLYLAETEVAVRGLQLELIGPFKRNNPDFDPEQEPGDDNPEKIEYYTVKDWDRTWSGTLTEDFVGGNSTTVQVRDITDNDPQTYDFTIHNNLIYDDEYYGKGLTVLFQGHAGTDGNKLTVIGEACPSLYIPAPDPTE